jgi:hypothetical protein
VNWAENIQMNRESDRERFSDEKIELQVLKQDETIWGKEPCAIITGNET